MTSAGEGLGGPTGADGRAGIDLAGLRHVDPAIALRAGTLDPLALLVTWFLRRSWIPLFILGLAVAGILTQEQPDLDLSSPGGVVAAILSPWAGVAAAILLRLLTGVVGLLLAAPLTAWPNRADYPEGRVAGDVRRWRDRWQRAGAYRALRWTWPVRRLAAQRLGRSDAWLLGMERAWTVATVVAAVLWVFSTAVAFG